MGWCAIHPVCLWLRPSDGAPVAAGTAVDTSGSVDILLGIEQVDGSHFRDYLLAGTIGVALYGNGGDDDVIGGSGADTIGGGSGDDSVVGNGGNDIAELGSGNDTVDGGAGFDELRVVRGLAGGPLTFTLGSGAGAGTVTGLIADREDGDPVGSEYLALMTAFSGFERLSGSDLADTFTASGTITFTDEAATGPGGTHYIEVIGGAGNDSFIDSSTATSTGLGVFRINYDQEKYLHADYDPRRQWGANGETGVFVNLGASNQINMLGSGVDVGSFSAVDTFGDIDDFRQGTGPIDMQAFTLTDAADTMLIDNVAADVDAGGGDDLIVSAAVIGANDYLNGGAATTRSRAAPAATRSAAGRVMTISTAVRRPAAATTRTC